MKKILMIDDLRTSKDVREDPTKIARTFEEGIAALKSEAYDLLYLDHDLGEANGKDGSAIMNFLEENPQFLPGKIELITSNPIGRMYMQTVIDRLYGKGSK